MPSPSPHTKTEQERIGYRNRHSEFILIQTPTYTLTQRSIYIHTHTHSKTQKMVRRRHSVISLKWLWCSHHRRDDFYKKYVREGQTECDRNEDFFKLYSFQHFYTFFVFSSILRTSNKNPLPHPPTYTDMFIRKRYVFWGMGNMAKISFSWFIRHYFTRSFWKFSWNIRNTKL